MSRGRGLLRGPLKKLEKLVPDRVEKSGAGHGPKSGAGHGPGLFWGKAWKTGAGHGPKSGAVLGSLHFVRRRRRTHSKSGAGHGWTLSGAGAGRSSNRLRRHLPVLGVLACGVFAGILRQVRN